MQEKSQDILQKDVLKEDILYYNITKQYIYYHQGLPWWSSG